MIRSLTPPPPYLYTQLNLQNALEDSLQSLEDLEIVDAIRDMRALVQIEQDQMRLWDRLSQIKEYILSKLVAVMATFVINQDQEGIDFILKKFGYDTDNNTLNKSIYDIYESLTSLEWENYTQDAIYEEIRKKLKEDEILGKKEILEQQIQEQVQKYGRSLEQYRLLAKNLDTCMTPAQYAQDLKESLKSTKWDMNTWQQLLAMDVQDKILEYQNTREQKKEKLNVLRTELLQWRKSLEKIKFAEQEEKAQEMLVDLQSKSLDTLHPLTNEDCLEVIQYLEQRAKDIVWLRQQLKINSSLSVDLSAPKEAWKMSRPYMIQAYEIHADMLTKQEHRTLWVDVKYVSDLTPYLDQEIQKLGDDIKIFDDLLEREKHHFFDAWYAHPKQVEIVFLVHKHKETLEKIRILNRCMQHDKRKLAHIHILMDEYAGKKSPLSRFCLLHSADYIFDLEEQKTVVVKWDKFYELQWQMPHVDHNLNAVGLYNKYIDIRLIPITQDHILYQDLRNPNSKLTHMVQQSQKDKKYNDKLSIEQQYDILLQDSLYLYSTQSHEIQKTSQHPSWHILSNKLLSYGWDRYLTSTWEDVFEKSFVFAWKFDGSIAKVKDEWQYLMDRDGLNMLEGEYTDMGEYVEWYLAVQWPEGRHFLDETGKRSFDDRNFNEIMEKKFSEWFAAVKKRKKWFYINYRWENAFVDKGWENKIYDYAYPFSEWLAVVKKWDTYIIIDRQWKQMFGKTFFSIEHPYQFVDWKLRVQSKKGRDRREVDTKGNLIDV